MIAYTITRTFFCEKLKDIPQDGTIKEVDGRTVLAMCENCGKPICKGDASETSYDGIVTCWPKCSQAAKEEADGEKNPVT